MCFEVVDRVDFFMVMLSFIDAVVTDKSEKQSDLSTGITALLHMANKQLQTRVGKL